jgi:hypothetical protein
MLATYLHTEATCDEECEQDLQRIVLDDPSLMMSSLAPIAFVSEKLRQNPQVAPAIETLTY